MGKHLDKLRVQYLEFLILMANPIKFIIIILSCLANLQQIICSSSYRPQSPIFKQKRGNYDIWEAFGSDGYLYDFVKRNGKKESMMLPHLQSYLEQAKGSKYNIRDAFGSDGYLYDFTQ